MRFECRICVLRLAFHVFIQIRYEHPHQIKPKTVRFRLYFLHFRGKIACFSTTFSPLEISKFFLTTCVTTVGAEANRLVASAPVRSAQKTKFKRFPEVFPREPFSLFPAYQFLVTPYNDLPADLVALLADSFQFQNHFSQEFFFA